MKNEGRISELRWSHYSSEMRPGFSENEFSDPMFKIVRLRHTGSADEYYEEFEAC